MKILNTIIVATFAFGTSVTADPGSIRNVDEGGVTPIHLDFLQGEDGEDWGCGRGNGCRCWRDGNCNSGRCSSGFKCADKLNNGHGCGEDDDCKSGRCSKGFKCYDKLNNGEGCLEDEDCMSGRCSKGFKCYDKLKDGESCGFDDDCVSNHCSNLYQCESQECITGGVGKPNGCSCVFDYNCLSHRCSKGLKCENKLENGNGCAEDDDCESGRCSALFKCEAPLENGSFCTEDPDCESGRCGGGPLGVVWKCEDKLKGGQTCWQDRDCEASLSCFKNQGLKLKGTCRDYAELMNVGNKGTCKQGSPAGEIKVMTYNLFFIPCYFPGGLNPYPCQHEKEQKPRVDKLEPWFSQSDADVVMFQEVFTHREDIITAMTNAGFCYYISNVYEYIGSGKQIFSKYPLENADFMDFYDITVDPELKFSDRGVMYAKVVKDGEIYHVGNTHTSSNSMGEKEATRREEYKIMRSFLAEKNPNTNEMVLYGGDMNEDKYNHKVGDKYYQNMLAELHASEPPIVSAQNATYDTYKNPIPASFQDDDYQELLDFVLISNEYAQAQNASCEILIPQWPLNCGGGKECMISDHFPNVCTFNSMGNTTSAVVEIGDTNIHTSVA